MARDILTPDTEAQVATALQPWFTGSQQEALIAATDKAAKAAYDEGFDNTTVQVDALANDLASTAAGKGSDMVGFLQSGTGSVSRVMQDKAREWMTPQDKGAVGDNTTIASNTTIAGLTAFTPKSFAFAVSEPGAYLEPGDCLYVDFTSAGTGKALTGAVVQFEVLEY